MVATIIFGGRYLRAGSMAGALLAFLLILFLVPEPTESLVEDYLPSSRARTIAVKIVKLLKPYQGEICGAGSHDFAVCGFSHSIAVCQASVDVELHVQLRHFGLLTNRLVRSPPQFSL